MGFKNWCFEIFSVGLGFLGLFWVWDFMVFEIGLVLGWVWGVESLGGLSKFGLRVFLGRRVRSIGSLGLEIRVGYRSFGRFFCFLG